MIGRQPLVGFVAVAFLCLCAPGCNSKGDSEENLRFATSPTVTNAIGASGSTFINPIMTNWIGSFQKLHPNIRINYRSIGSGGGIDEFRKQMVEFAASDAPLDDGKIADLFPMVQVPVTAGPVCVIYNLPDLKAPIKLSPVTLAGIYLGKIVTWQDSSIARDNPGVKLPTFPVIVVHRVDGSGTTNIFTTYLTKVSPEWARKAGSATPQDGRLLSALGFRARLYSLVRDPSQQFESRRTNQLRSRETDCHATTLQRSIPMHWKLRSVHHGRSDT